MIGQNVNKKIKKCILACSQDGKLMHHGIL